jgi:hypothetical protein
MDLDLASPTDLHALAQQAGIEAGRCGDGLLASYYEALKDTAKVLAWGVATKTAAAPTPPPDPNPEWGFVEGGTAGEVVGPLVGEDETKG